MPEFHDKVRIPEVTALRQTENALLVRVDGEEVWIPQSQIDDDSEVYKAGHAGVLVVSAWIAEKKGIG